MDTGNYKIRRHLPGFRQAVASLPRAILRVVEWE
jgi:hypothetical protein